MTQIAHFIGIVKGGMFYPFIPKSEIEIPCRLTSIQMQEARPPESGEINLAEYEGAAIMVSGHGGGWIYSASIIEKAGPLLTEVVKEVFGKEIESGELESK